MQNPSETVEVANAVDNDEAQFLSDALTDPSPTNHEDGRPRDAQGRFVPQEPVAAVEPESGTAEAAVPEAPKHSVRMLRMAADLGISEEDAGDYNAEQLEAVIHERHKQLISHARRPQKPIDEPKAVAEPEPSFGIDAEAFPELVAHLKSEAKEKKALAAKLAELEKREAKREQDSHVSQLDQAFAAYPDFFGTESVGELAHDDPKMLRRQAALAIMKMGDQNKGLKKLLANAIAVLNFAPAAKPTNGVKDVVYGDKDVQKNRKADAVADDVGGRLSQRQTEWSEAGLAVPSQRHPAKEVPGLATAKKHFVEEARAAGLAVTSSYDPEDENFEH